MNKLNLFEDQEDQQNEKQDNQKIKLKINRQFADKFEKRKQRQIIDQAKVKYGDNYKKIIEGDQYNEDSSSELEDDSEGELLNEKVSVKFIKTLAKIREKDPSIYKTEKQFFKEKDFGNLDIEQENKNKQQKRYTYKDMIQEEVLGKIDDEDYSENSEQQNKQREETRIEEQQRLKQEFKRAALKKNEEEDNLFIQTKKTNQQVEDENKEFNKFLEKQKKRKLNKGKDQEIEILQKFWGNENKLDEADRFLRKFILTKGYLFIIYRYFLFIFLFFSWVDKDDINVDQKLEEQDEEEDDKADLFESKYNFRYEEENGNQIVSSYLGSDYYDQEDENLDELKEYEKKFYKQQEKNDENDDTQQNKQKEKPETQLGEDKENLLNPKVNIPLASKKNLKDNEIQAMIQNDKDQNGVYLWWYCDNCKKGIKPGQFKYDCVQCPDFTLCKLCNDGKFHEHNTKKSTVPQNCQPPSDGEILEILNQYKVCNQCFIKLDDYCSYYQLQSNNEIIICDECFDKVQIYQKKLYEYVEAKKVNLEELAQNNPAKLKKYVNDEEIQKLVDQYYSVDFEDVITGGIKTRFKYLDVRPESYGLSDEQLLFADNHILNKYVSIKKLAPYRDDEGKVKQKNLKNKLIIKQIQNSSKENKKIIKKDQEQGLTFKENLKELKKKDKKKYLKELKKIQQQKEEIKQKKIKQEEQKNTKPQLILEDLSKQETKITKDRLKSYGL
ncbi:zz domain protein [Ichthyophthirius multifiliis]|uniref:Zz domain protein n=1 Tax=Ichthyophthirius multifiliis TaxID=5932 RepID=G0R3R3_ICHMU|nr:zz domain protein [Ichthyophthirius multifiliis]EGR27880.1 zz domain protein [Ichthyophthirius multifiliis]|eukprot:XP_004027225.1 zz domain protein [Ichthyophthirius multifiliis]